MREFLVVDLRAWSVITQEEYKQLGSIFGRMGSSFNAFSQAWCKRLARAHALQSTGQ